MERWNAAAKLVKEQFGLITVWQAAKLGISRDLVAERAEREGWDRVMHGVYLLPGHALGPLARVKALELALRFEGAASHRTAAYLWEIRTRLPATLDFIVPSDCQRRPGTATIRESKGLSRHGTGRTKGIAVISPAWTICTLAAVISVPELKEAIGIAHRKRLLTPSTLETFMKELAPFKGVRKVRQALAELADEGLCHSGLERLGRERLRGAGYEPHPLPYSVEVKGELIAELDIAFVAEKVGIPVQGPHHFFPDQARYDDDQRFKLESIGWRVIPVDEHRLRNQPEVFLRQVRVALEERRAALAKT